MSQTVVQTILGENFMHDAEQGLDLASVVENEVCVIAKYVVRSIICKSVT